jgi:hypothetical protein
MPFVGGGATAFLDRFFVDVYAQAAYDGEDTDTLQNAQIFSNDFQNRKIDREWDRQEYSISGGYAVTDNVAIFAGYRLSETNFEDRTTIFDIGTQSTSFADIDVDYEQEGPFVGGTFQVPVEQGFLVGAMSANLGIAFVDGEVKQDVRGGPSASFEGDTVGLTVGFSWKGLITDNLRYTVGIDGYRYEFDADESEDFQGADFSETIIRGTVGLSYAF